MPLLISLTEIGLILDAGFQDIGHEDAACAGAGAGVTGAAEGVVQSELRERHKNQIGALS